MAGHTLEAHPAGWRVTVLAHRNMRQEDVASVSTLLRGVVTVVTREFRPRMDLVVEYTVWQPALRDRGRFYSG